MKYRAIPYQLIFIFFIFQNVLSAQDLRFESDENIFRYKSILDNSAKLNKIRISNLDFPCMDEYKINVKDASDGQIDLVSGIAPRESYIFKKGQLYVNGYRGLDPFLQIPDKDIVFLSPVVYGWPGDSRANEFTGTTDFLLSYQRDQVPAFILDQLDIKGVNTIRISGEMIWDMKFIGDIWFSDMMGRIEGHAFNHTHIYQVKEISVRADKWHEINMKDFPEIWDLFDSQTLIFQNFFGVDDMLDRIRLYDQPHKSIVYHSKKPFFGLEKCTNNERSIYVFPNPTYGDLNIQINDSKNENYIFSIYNIIGKKLWSQSIKSSDALFKTTLDIPGFEKGVYLYTLVDEEGSIVKSQRLIIIEP